MATCKVHNVCFYKPKPKAIYCMTFNKKTQKLALSRSDASIEIWNLKDSAIMVKRFPPSVKNYSIEGLAWCESRLFSVGLHAILFEYNLKQLSIKRQTSVTGQTAFCLDVNKDNTHIAVGTEQGYLNIFSIADDDLVFEKFLDKQEGRILCLRYDHTGEYIVSGGMDTIRVWNVRTGHAIHKMTTGRSETNKATIVWCISITKNFTIITGDSRGKLSFWDGKVGAQMESYQSHRADILSLCLSDDENELYCAGIDANIICYKNIAVRSDCHKWVKSIQRKVHDHDVRALILNQKCLYSGGVDGYLAYSYYPPKTLVKYPPIAQHPNNCIEIATKCRYILLKYPKNLELWTLSDNTEDEKSKTEIGGTMCAIKNKPKKLLVLQRQVKTDMGVKREGIVCSSISTTGRYIVFSTLTILRLFKFDYMPDKEPCLTACDLQEKSPCVNALFTPDSTQLIVALQSGDLQVLNILDTETTKVQVISTEKYVHDTITFLEISPCGQYLIAADSESNIAIWKHNATRIDAIWEFYLKLPKHCCCVTAIAIQGSSKSLIVAYNDHKISEFNLITRKLSDLSAEVVDKNNKLFTKNCPIRNILHFPVNDSILLHDDSNIQVIKFHQNIAPKSPKISKIETSEKNATNEMLSVHAIKKYKHLIHLGVLSDNELVAVEVSPLTLLEQLPPGFKHNTFGTK